MPPDNTIPQSPVAVAPGAADSPTIPAQESALAATNTQLDLSALSADAARDAQLIGVAVSAYKQHGALALIPQLKPAEAAVESTIRDGAAVVADIKSGWKTTEFWLLAASVAVPGIGELFGHPLPVGLSLTGVGAAAVYAAIRAAVKILSN